MIIMIIRFNTLHIFLTDSSFFCTLCNRVDNLSLLIFFSIFFYNVNNPTKMFLFVTEYKYKYLQIKMSILNIFILPILLLNIENNNTNIILQSLTLVDRGHKRNEIYQLNLRVLIFVSISLYFSNYDL